ncbi:MAG TPA: hypothetical protein VLE20_02450, partial [Blastocatellia bacterium]|nr:hypothetical protein [Blastocatellia bacterium]
PLSCRANVRSGSRTGHPMSVSVNGRKGSEAEIQTMTLPERRASLLSASYTSINSLTNQLVQALENTNLRIPKVLRVFCIGPEHNNSMIDQREKLGSGTI